MEHIILSAIKNVITRQDIQVNHREEEEEEEVMQTLYAYDGWLYIKNSTVFTAWLITQMRT
jgi:hypothetical protein